MGGSPLVPLGAVSDSSKPDFERLYAIGEEHKRGHMRAAQISGPGYDELRPLARGELSSPSAPVAFKRDEGSKRVDIMGTTWGPAVLLASQRFADVMTEHGFTGWGLYPVEIVDRKKDEAIEGYHGLVVTGRCGPTDESLSERFIAPPPSPAGRPSPARRGVYFRDGWDGSDIFMPPNTDWRIVTEEVKAALEAAGTFGIRFERLAEIVLRG